MHHQSGKEKWRVFFSSALNVFPIFLSVVKNRMFRKTSWLSMQLIGWKDEGQAFIPLPPTSVKGAEELWGQVWGRSHPPLPARAKWDLTYFVFTGNVVNIQTGHWVGKQSGLGAGLDSFYEYLLKSYILFGEKEDLEMFNAAYHSIQNYLRRGYVPLTSLVLPC